MTDAMAVYRCYRSNALWFASLRQDAYSVTLRAGLTFKFEQGEMMKCANGWAEKAIEYWRKLQLAGVPDAVHFLNGSSVGSTTNALNADTPAYTNQACICPDCMRRAMMKGNCDERQ